MSRKDPGNGDRVVAQSNHFMVRFLMFPLQERLSVTQHGGDLHHPGYFVQYLDQAMKEQFMQEGVQNRAMRKLDQMVGKQVQ